jgi:uncharacterized protein YbjT (DUF2867 family)
MNIAVFGGTGKTGRLVVQLALAAGHKVRVLARDPDKIPPAFGLEFVKGDALDGGKVMATLAGCEAAILALGNVKNGPVDLCSRVTDLVLQAAGKTGTATLVAMTSLGVGDSQKDVPWVFQLIVKLLLKKVFEDKVVQEGLLRGSNLNWVVIRPSGLLDGEATGRAPHGTGPMRQNIPQGRVPKGQVTRADVAALLLRSALEPEFARKTWFVTE